MKQTDLNHDPWNLDLQPEDGGKQVVAEPFLNVKDLGIVSPLAPQAEAESVPADLARYLFPSNAEGSVNAFAVIDAGKIFNLPELLESSGLEYECLYRGKSFEDLGNVAPWVVKLDAANTFTHRLFQEAPDSGPSIYLWAVDLGIYVVSPHSLEQIVRHFRKFTRVRDQTGKWFFFRFWESVTWDALVETPPEEMTFVSELVEKNQVIFRSATSFEVDRFFLSEWKER